MTLRVVQWSTGNVGKHTIAGIDARPDLELAGVWVSNPAKVGRDAGELAGLGRELGIKATTDRDALIAVLRTLVLDPELRRRLGTSARELVDHRFDAVTNTHELVELLKDVAAR